MDAQTFIHKKHKFLHWVLGIELVFIFFGAAFTWTESADVTNALRYTTDQTFPEVKSMLELSWLNEKVVELTTRYVASVRESNSGSNNFSKELIGYFRTELTVISYRFENLYSRMNGTGSDRSANIKQAWTALQNNVTIKRLAEKNANATLDASFLSSASYRDAVQAASNAFYEVNTLLSDNIVSNMRSKMRLLDISRIIILCILVMLTVLSLLKAFAMVSVRYAKGLTTGKMTHATVLRRRLFLVILAVNVVAALVEGLATYFSSTDISARANKVLDVELVLAREAGYTLIYDAVLTGSASLYALNQNDFWSTRYNNYLDPLDASIRHSQSLAQTPEDLRIYSEIDKVNAILIDLETATLDNPSTLGYQSMYGDAYLSNKGIYNANANSFLERQNSRVLAQLSSQTETARFVLYLSIALTIAALVLSLMLHFWKGILGPDAESHGASSVNVTSAQSIHLKGQSSRSDGPSQIVSVPMHD